MHFHYTTYMATSHHKSPYPRGHEIDNFGRHLLGHHYYVHVYSLSEPCPVLEKKIFKKHINFTLLPQITPKLPPLRVECTGAKPALGLN